MTITLKKRGFFTSRASFAEKCRLFPTPAQNPGFHLLGLWNILIANPSKLPTNIYTLEQLIQVVQAAEENAKRLHDDKQRALTNAEQSNPQVLQTIQQLQREVEELRKQYRNTVTISRNIVLRTIEQHAQVIEDNSELPLTFRSPIGQPPLNSAPLQTLSEWFADPTYAVQFVLRCPKYVRRLEPEQLILLTNRQPDNLELHLLVNRELDARTEVPWWRWISNSLRGITAPVRATQFPPITEEDVRNILGRREEMKNTNIKALIYSALYYNHEPVPIAGVLDAIIGPIQENTNQEFSNFFKMLHTDGKLQPFLIKLLSNQSVTAKKVLSLLTPLAYLADEDPSLFNAIKKTLPKESDVVRQVQAMVARRLTRDPTDPNIAEVADSQLIQLLRSDAITRWLGISGEQLGTWLQHRIGYANQEALRLFTTTPRLLAGLNIEPGQFDNTRLDNRLARLVLQNARDLHNAMRPRFFSRWQESSIKEFLTREIVNTDRPNQALCDLVSQDENLMRLLRECAPTHWYQLFTGTKQRVTETFLQGLAQKSPFLSKALGLNSSLARWALDNRIQATNILQRVVNDDVSFEYVAHALIADAGSTRNNTLKELLDTFPALKDFDKPEDHDVSNSEILGDRFIDPMDPNFLTKLGQNVGLSNALLTSSYLKND